MPEETRHESHPVATSESPNGKLAAHARPPADNEHEAPMDLPRVPGAIVGVIVVVLILLFGGLFLLGWIPHQRRMARAAAEATEAADTKPVVEAAPAREAPADSELLLPADVRANQMTSIFARTNGYLKPLPAGIDIGAGVKEGELIAEIASPEVDAQLEQEKASLEQARAAVIRATEEHSLATSTLERYETLAGTHAVSQQDIDARRTQESVTASALKEAESSVRVAEAAVKRLTELQQFEKVIAPFSGVITSRGYDAGALITSGQTDSSKSMFTIEQVNVLRVQVDVPQGYAADVKVGQPAELLVPTFPSRTFPGTVARTAGAISPTTRTLLVEVDVPNEDRTLMPGMYGQVRFQVHRQQPALIVPASALVFGTSGMSVQVVKDGRVYSRPISIGRDFGTETEIVGGISKDDKIVKNPGAWSDGTEVTVKKN